MTRRPAPRRPRLARALGTPGLDRARGLSPGTPLHVGEAHGEAPRLRVMTYGPGTFEEREISSLEELGPLPDAAVTWLDVDGLHDTALLRAAGDRFDLHPMLLEDIANTTQRPKLEVFGDRLFVVCKMLSWDPVAREVRVEQLALLLGAGWVITFQERPGDVFDPLRDRIRRGAGRVRSMGAAYLAYALLDAVVDGYFGILEHVGNALEPLEEQMIREGDPRTVQALHRWRHEILMLRRAAWPLRDVASALSRGGNPRIPETVEPFLRDLHDHTLLVVDTLEGIREVITGLLDLHVTLVSHRLNEVMRLLTVIATIFIPLTFLAGVWGMNFRHMPELGWTWAYPWGFWGVILAVGGGMVWFFRRKRWF